MSIWSIINENNNMWGKRLSYKKMDDKKIKNTILFNTNY